MAKTVTQIASQNIVSNQNIQIQPSQTSSIDITQSMKILRGFNSGQYKADIKTCADTDSINANFKCKLDEININKR